MVLVVSARPPLHLKSRILEPFGIQETTLATTTLNAFIDEIARAIGQPEIWQLAGEQKNRALIDSLRGMNALLILDNLETLTSAEQSAIGEFLRNLPMECKAIVTSRRRASEAAVTIRLEKLDWETARELIESEMERHSDVKRALTRASEAGWKQLYDETGGSPLALTWTIGMIRARGFSFERALELLRNGSAESDLNAYIFRQAQEKMDTNENAVLGALSLFDGPATFDALSMIANLDHRALDVVLERLRALSFVDIIESELGEEQYSLHPLTRRFVQMNVVKDTEIERSMKMRFSQYTLDREQAFAARMEGLRALQRKEYFEAEHLLKEALNYWRNLSNDEWIAIVLNDLGELARKQMNYDTAEQYLVEALKLSRRVNNKLGEVDYIGNLGELALDREQWAEACKWFEQEFLLAKEIGRQDLIAQSQYGLSRVEEMEGHTDLALPLAQEALRVYERLQHQNLTEARKLVERLLKTKG
jgi:tetratricopeptide (TPR) repeat protein